MLTVKSAIQMQSINSLVKKLPAMGLMLLLMFQGCKTTQTVTKTEDEWPEPEITSADGNYVINAEEKDLIPEWVSEKGPYQPETARYFDLHHTRIEATFDWQKQHLLGKATLTLSPHFYAQDSVVLDAKGFDLHRVSLINGKDTTDLSLRYNGQKINIRLPKRYTKADKLTLFIDYTAKPNKLEASGSEAITSDKGLYFINPTGADPFKPRQIWTQGETEASSCWFPTFDSPNVKTTEELLLTVDTAFVTVANGKLIGQKKHANGTRTDHWKQDKPHAPYLFAFAVGEFAKVTDSWNGLEVSYYVEKAQEKYARAVFGNTPEMIGFFSEKFDYPYPWDKYAQVVVRDFVSGAMENTSVSIFMEQLNVDSRYLLDENWDGIISHELFHHWFGDVVTAESWANLPLNESFANYGEYLWAEHKYGREEADLIWLEALEGYLYEAEKKREPMIRYFYTDKEDMFDSHSYAKGCLLLHLLRKQIGDEAFFTALQLYLKKHAFGTAEIHQLRLAFEEVTGTDLNWFFNQWFLEAGHPDFFIQEEYENGQLYLSFVQQQDPKYTPLYRFPIDIDIWVSGKKTRHQVLLKEKQEKVRFKVEAKPDLVLFDPEHVIPGEVDYLRTTDAFIYQFRHAESVLHKLTALEELVTDITEPSILPVFKEALNDKFWKIRQVAAESFSRYEGPEKESVVSTLKEMAVNDPKSLVRAAALAAVISIESDISLIAKTIADSSYTVLATSLYGYVNAGGEDPLMLFERYENIDNPTILATIADFYANFGVAGKYSWFDQKIKQSGGQKQLFLLNYVGQYLMKLPQVSRIAGIDLLADLAQNAPNYQTRMTAFRSLMLLTDSEGVEDKLKLIQAAETDPKVLEFYQTLGMY